MRNDSETFGLEWKSAERIVKIIANDLLTVRIRTFNFPGWTAHIDGIPAMIKSEDGTKAILVDVPKGDHFLKLNFKDTPIRIIGKIVSLLSFIILLAGLLWPKHNSKKLLPKLSVSNSDRVVKNQ